MPGRKVGILNFQYSTHNFGAVLQAAALEYTLRELGYDAKHIDFLARPSLPIKRRVRTLFRDIYGRGIRNAQHAGNEEAFERFRREFLTRTERIQTAKEFQRVAKNFDSIVVGSDQVWRLQFARDPMAFFLGYVPDGVERISYAASFGTAAWEHSDDVAMTESVRHELAKFKAISCREDSGVRICSDTFGVTATHVLDPLLLVEQGFFNDVGMTPFDKRKSQIVVYKLDSSDDFHDDLGELAAVYECSPINIYLKDGQPRAYYEVPDWLSSVFNSDVVITDSFHCICLALRFGKVVIYCPNDRRGEARMGSLFTMLNIGLEGCIPGLKTQMYKLISPMDMDELLERKRGASMQFLATALAG